MFHNLSTYLHLHINNLIDVYRDVINQALTEQTEDLEDGAPGPVPGLGVFVKIIEVKSLPPPVTEVSFEALIRKEEALVLGTFAHY